MSILIKMEMPISCADCRFYGAYCYAKGDEDEHSTLPCPLVPVPPHGRLIDADALCDGLVSNHPVVIYAKSAPTIIEAEGKE